MDRDTLFYQMLARLAKPKWDEGKDTDQIAYELRLEQHIDADEGSVANALARLRDAAFRPAVAA